MIRGAAFALSFTNPGLLEKVLAVLASALLGGFLVGLLLQVLVKAVSGQKVPRRILQVMRLLGAVAAGLLVAALLGGGGGWGWGRGSGGLGGKDQGTGSNKPATQRSIDKEGGGEVGPVLRVEVLTNQTAKQLGGEEAVAAGKFYHVLKTDEKALLTLDELKQEIRKRASGKPPLKRLDVVEGPDNPIRELPRVADLANWAREQGLTVAFTKP
jgi:hypothetical protein